MQEEKLIKRIIEGSEEAFKELVETYKDKVYNTCFGFVHNKEDADDLAQEVFIKIFHSIHQFQKHSSLATWIYRISMNASVNFLNKQKKNKQLLTSIKELRLEQEHQEEITTEIREKILWICINKLPVNQKKALVLSKFEKLSHKEISDVMNISISSVESLIFRAKKNLKTSIQKKIKKIIE